MSKEKRWCCFYEFSLWHDSVMLWLWRLDDAGPDIDQRQSGRICRAWLDPGHAGTVRGPRSSYWPARHRSRSLSRRCWFFGRMGVGGTLEKGLLHTHLLDTKQGSVWCIMSELSSTAESGCVSFHVWVTIQYSFTEAWQNASYTRQ